MSTRVISLPPETFDPAEVSEAAMCVRKGGLVVFPTETVYGVAVNRDDPQAVRRLLEVRQSPSDKNLTVHIASREEVMRYAARPLPGSAQKMIRRFWPGPLTLILPTPEGDTVGLRYPNHPVATALISQAQVPIVAPSANLSGEDPAKDADAARKSLEGKVDFILDAGPTRHQSSSTVVRVGKDGGVEVLREGAIPEGVVREVGDRSIVFVCTGNTCRSPMAEALFRMMLAKKLGVSEEELGEQGWVVLSAGTAAGAGSSASEHGVEVVRERGGQLEGHRSRPVSVTMIEDAERVYTMTRSHYQTLVQWMPDHVEKIQLLDPSGAEISDPIGGSRDVYRTCAEKIHEAVTQRLQEVFSS